MQSEALMKRALEFWERASNVGDASKCWDWECHLAPKGYGLFHWPEDGKIVGTGAHRAAYIITFGHGPEGLDLDHLCRNRKCVNPYHLEAVTHAENIKRGRTGAYNREKTHCKRGHLLAGYNVKRIEHRNERKCRKCAVIYAQAYQRRQREKESLA